MPWGGNFVLDNFKTTARYFHNFSVAFFLSGGTHQSHIFTYAKQCALTITLPVPSLPYVFDNHYVTQ